MIAPILRGSPGCKHGLPNSGCLWYNGGEVIGVRSRLFAWGVLIAAGLMPMEDYVGRLHELFLEGPDDPLLMELEECTAGVKDTVAKLLALEGTAEAVAEEIIPYLERVYRSGSCSTEEFHLLAARMCRFLPEQLSEAEPFRTLCYIGYYEEYAGEARVREMYERFFRDRPVIEDLMAMPPNPTKKSLLKRLFGRKK